MLIYIHESTVKCTMNYWYDEAIVPPDVPNILCDWQRDKRIVATDAGEIVRYFDCRNCVN